MLFDLVNLILLANFEGLTFDLDQDGVANPGEEVLYDFSISNLSNGINAQSIIANIVTTTNDVSIVNPIIDFGNINYNNQEVTLNLDEKYKNTSHFQTYKSTQFIIKRTFTNDFDF